MTEIANSQQLKSLATPAGFEQGKCCCCRELPCIKNLWSEHIWMGCKEVYGSMLMECFNIAWPQNDNLNYQICEVCITQLRNALHFKQRIVQSHAALLDAVSTIKEEPADIKIESSDPDTGTQYTSTETFISGDNQHIERLHDNSDDSSTEASSEDDAEIPTESRKRRRASYNDKQRRISKRHNIPSYAQPNTSIDDSLDVTDSEKHEDDVPSTDDDTTNSSNLNSNSLDDVANYLDDSSRIGIDSDLNYNKTDQRAVTADTERPENTWSDSVVTANPLLDVASNIIGANAKILADDSNSSINENSDYSNVPQSQYPMNIPPTENDKSYLKITKQSLSQRLCRIHVPQTDTNKWDPTNNHTATSQSLSQDHSIQIQDVVPSTSSRVSDDEVPNLPNDSSSEFDNSDRDATFNPVSDSSSVRSDTEETLNDMHQKQLSVRLRRLDNHQNFTTSNKNTNDNGKKLKRIRTKDHCFFCDLDVLNFARHISRKHSTEPEVQKIIRYPKKSVIRKNLLTELRKKGNYIKNVVKCDKPVKRSSLHVYYVPCEKCLGFYSRKHLWKHKKTCQPLSQTTKTQVQAQNFMMINLNIDKKLKDKVFPKMRPDKISLEAKRDMLICAFGAKHLRIHREKRFVNITSRKMRELAKLLLELKALKPSLKNLMDFLKPQNYNLIVSATKKVSGYDDVTNRYAAPTYAMNISTSLKQCCNIAIMTISKSSRNVHNAAVEADLKMLIHLIEANWKIDLSSQPSHLKKCNKITIVPLAADLKLVKNYLREKSKSAANKLRESETSCIEAYNTLSETVYCRVLLLNRLRPGEVQRLPLNIYQENNNDNAYEEFDRDISSVEKMLVKCFKRILIRGKRGQSMSVLLTDEIQSDIDLLISMRGNYIDAKQNGGYHSKHKKRKLYYVPIVNNSNTRIQNQDGVTNSSSIPANSSSRSTGTHLNDTPSHKEEMLNRDNKSQRSQNAETLIKKLNYVKQDTSLKRDSSGSTKSSLITNALVKKDAEIESVLSRQSDASQFNIPEKMMTIDSDAAESLKESPLTKSFYITIGNESAVENYEKNDERKIPVVKNEPVEFVDDSDPNNAAVNNSTAYSGSIKDENSHLKSVELSGDNEENNLELSRSKNRRLTKSQCEVVDGGAVRPNAHITEQDRQRIVLLREDGLSIADIARELGVARNTVYLWIRRWQNEGSLQEVKKTGRPRKTSQPEDFNIIHQFKENPLSRTRNVATTHNISLNTVRRRLREAGVQYKVSAPKLKLDNSHK